MLKYLPFTPIDAYNTVYHIGCVHVHYCLDYEDPGHTEYYTVCFMGIRLFTVVR